MKCIVYTQLYTTIHNFINKIKMFDTKCAKIPLNKGCMRCIFIDYTSCISKEYRLYLRKIQVIH